MKNENLTVEYYEKIIAVFITKNGKKPLSMRELEAKCKSRKGNTANFHTALKNLTRNGIIIERKKGFILAKKLNLFKGEITTLCRTYGFAKSLDDETIDRIFIPGKFLMGSMPGDTVLMKLIPSRSEGASPEAEVVSVLEENTSRMSGTVVSENGKFYVIPDTMGKNHVLICDNGNAPFCDGDKVLAEIASRGSRHADHKVRVITSFGSADKAVSCADALLAVNGVEKEFPYKVIKEAKKINDIGILPEELENRLDLRDEIIFTIDGAESKDLDDAVSIKKLPDGFMLGVHIADVSYYVKGNSALDKEALLRGTSVYYANKVIPMLPKELSNGICSLNPNEDRLTFSCFAKLDNMGKVVDYSFKKSVICSRVKGVYSEINSILDGTETPEIAQKYDGLKPTIFLMDELADILTAAKIGRGAPSIDTDESKLIIDENDTCIDVVPRTRGKSEMIIEEFMLIANQCAANLGRTKNVPFVYRIHENPDPQKITTLKTVLDGFHITMPQFDEIKPGHLAKILVDAKDKPEFPVINTIILRTMSKARYAPEPVGHFGLSLEDYAHFTSPIRRYPDLSIHRILSDIVSGYDTAWLQKRYEAFVRSSSEKSSNAEIKAMHTERDCEDCYKAEYMLSHVGQEYDGIISSVAEHGLYVCLPNTVEGLVHVNTLPTGNYSSDNLMYLREELSNKEYRLGEKVKVVCTKANVPLGQVDFSLVEE